MYLRIKQTFLWGRKIFDDSEFKAKLKNGLKSFDLNEDDFYSIMVVPLMAFFETSKDSLSASL